MLRLPSLAVFRHRAYANFWWARVMSALAMQIQTTAIGWQIYDAARSQGRTIEEAAFVLGGYGLAQFLPLLLFSLVGGQAADRCNRKAILFFCLVMKAVVAGVLIYATGLPADKLVITIFVTAVITGALNAFLPAVNTAMAPMLVPREDLPQAIAWGSLGFQASVIGGPAVGGVLLTIGASAPYVITLCLLASSALLIFLTSTPKQEPVKDARTIGLIMEGLRYVWSNKIVLGAISLDLVVVLLGGAAALLPVFARDYLHSEGKIELGALRSSMGVGAAVVAMGLAVNPVRRNVGRWMFGATILFGLAMALFGFSRWVWLSSALLVIAGGADMISVFVRQTLIQLATPDPMRGRVGAVSYAFISASNELGDFESGVMARILGPVTAVALGGFGAVAASFGWMKLFPQLAQADAFSTHLEQPIEPQPAPRAGAAPSAAE